MVGANVFLKKQGEEGLSDAIRDLVEIADAQSADGQKVAWEWHPQSGTWLREGDPAGSSAA